MKKNKLKQKDKRLILLDAAKSIFAWKGYEGTTVRSISKKARMNVSMVSYYYSGKEGLFKAVLEEFGSERLRITKQILTAPDSKQDFKTKLVFFVDQIFTFHIDDPEITTILHRECMIDSPIVQEAFKNTFLKSISNEK